MKTFHCSQCQNLVFFENEFCLQCGCLLAYDPASREMLAIGASVSGLLAAQHGRSCQNRERFNVCNWLVASDEPGEFCRACSLNRTIPNLGKPENLHAWRRLEVAKRRLLYSLDRLSLRVVPKSRNPGAGLAFDFLEDSAGGDSQRVMTGHDNGLITVNIAEADDVYRERQRAAHGEPHRTLLGHLRHEIGHYFWDRLVAGTDFLDSFRALFGDERQDYSASLERHYRDGPLPDWQTRYISAYAAMHPWEDWAETWAHYLHMVDTLETANCIGLLLLPSRPDEPRLSAPVGFGSRRDFDLSLQAWHSLTYGLNNLNRGLGLPDGYPFVLSAPVVEKLRFIDQLVHSPEVRRGLPTSAQ